MPKVSAQKTTAAVLRALTGLRDVEMAELLKCSVNTIWSLESGRLKLSDAMAVRIAQATGISLAWLLSGDPKAAPVQDRGQPYTREVFENHAARLSGRGRVSPDQFSVEFVWHALQLRKILLMANHARNFHLGNYKLRRLLDTLEKEFQGPVPAGSIAKDGHAAAQMLQQHIADFTRIGETLFSDQPSKPSLDWQFAPGQTAQQAVAQEKKRKPQPRKSRR